MFITRIKQSLGEFAKSLMIYWVDEHLVEDITQNDRLAENGSEESAIAFHKCMQHAERAICYRPSICPSVCLSVRLSQGWISQNG